MKGGFKKYDFWDSGLVLIVIGKLDFKEGGQKMDFATLLNLILWEEFLTFLQMYVCIFVEHDGRFCPSC